LDECNSSHAGGVVTLFWLQGAVNILAGLVLEYPGEKKSFALAAASPDWDMMDTDFDS
jgi:hypothetical protein